MVTIGFLVPEEEVAETPDEPQADDNDGPRKKKRKWRKKKRQGPRYSGNATTGDRLGGPGTRDLNAAQGGGEEQLLDNEIEAGFDQIFPKIRRCLMLVESEDPVRGKLMFGMRIAGTGRITKVNINGPAVVTRSEAGGCMRQAAKSLQFRSFNGPDMLVHLPITLD